VADLWKTICVQISSVAADKALTAADRGLVVVDAAAGNRTVTLPPANAALGVIDFIVRRADNSVNRLVVQTSGADKIKFHTHLRAAGYSFLPLMGSGDWWHFRSDGAGNWWPVGRFDTTPLGRPVFETTLVLQPGGYGGLNSAVFNRADWPWLWDHAQQSSMLTTEAARVGMEGGWTSGDGVLTFRGPEGRGEFLQVLDEARSVDPGRAAGSWKDSQNKDHAHTTPGAGNFGTQMQGGGSNNYSQWTPGTTGRNGGADARPRGIAYAGRIKLI
jgi:hypothetical protein